MSSLKEIPIERKDSTQVCYDGKENVSNCGIGVCNDFGCYCQGGCRLNELNTTNEAKRLHESIYHLQQVFKKIIESNEFKRT